MYHYKHFVKKCPFFGISKNISKLSFGKNRLLTIISAHVTRNIWFTKMSIHSSFQTFFGKTVTVDKNRLDFERLVDFMLPDISFSFHFYTIINCPSASSSGGSIQCLWSVPLATGLIIETQYSAHITHICPWYRYMK